MELDDRQIRASHSQAPTGISLCVVCAVYAASSNVRFPPKADIRETRSMSNLLQGSMQRFFITIKRLGSGDADLAEEMNVLFGEVFGDHETYQARPPRREYLQGLLGKDHVIAIAALVGSELAGGLVAYELEKLESVRREIYIYDLAVREPQRRQGVATSLIGEVKRIAQGRSASVIFVQADYGDEPAIALYRKLGSKEEVLHFDIPV